MCPEQMPGGLGDGVDETGGPQVPWTSFSASHSTREAGGGAPARLSSAWALGPGSGQGMASGSWDMVGVWGLVGEIQDKG